MIELQLKINGEECKVSMKSEDMNVGEINTLIGNLEMIKLHLLSEMAKMTNIKWKKN